MWTLWRQWRFVRWVDKELLRHEEEQNITPYGAAILLSVQQAIPEYRSRWWVRASDVSVKRLMELSVNENYLSTQTIEDIGLSLKVEPKGTHFVPVLSGLIFGEIALLDPIRAFLVGGGLVAILWFIHTVT